MSQSSLKAPAAAMPVHHARMVAPDVARGFALLGAFVTAAMSTWFSPGVLTVGTYFGGIREGSSIDKIAVMLGAIAFHDRTIGLFATLVGFGVGSISLHLWNRGFTLHRTRTIVFRRYGFIALIGIAHSLILTNSDAILS